MHSVWTFSLVFISTDLRKPITRTFWGLFSALNPYKSLCEARHKPFVRVCVMSTTASRELEWVMHNVNVDVNVNNTMSPSTTRGQPQLATALKITLPFQTAGNTSTWTVIRRELRHACMFAAASQCSRADVVSGGESAFDSLGLMFTPCHRGIGLSAHPGSTLTCTPLGCCEACMAHGRRMEAGEEHTLTYIYVYIYIYTHGSA